MESRRVSQVFLVKSLMMILLWSPNCFAYLDPGTGGVILQIILGGIAGLLVSARLYWASVRNFFTTRMGFLTGHNKKSEINQDDNEESKVTSDYKN